VHRVGRTGRAGSKGEAYSFFTDEDARLAKELIEVLIFVILKCDS
jgi:ATP-dependent RNA helicase DDX5/DBP2